MVEAGARARRPIHYALMLTPKCDQLVHLGHAINVLTSLKHSTQKLAALGEAHCIVALTELRYASKLVTNCRHLRDK